jgi:hypothetical protein
VHALKQRSLREGQCQAEALVLRAVPAP